MSKNFKQQDYFRYKKLGIKWRKPRGRQSKLRLGKGGSGRKPSVGYGTEKTKMHMIKGLRVFNIRTASQLGSLPENSGIFISGSVGSKKAVEIYKAASEKGFTVLNMRRVKSLLRKEKVLKKIAESAKKEEKQV